MATEIEKKFRLSAASSERAALILDALGTYAGERFEENTIFDTGPLTGRPSILRIRKFGNSTILTYKRRVVSSSDAKEQIEYETAVSDRSAIENILKEIGLRPSVIYEKRRRIWRVGDAEIVLDTLPFGQFMEIEGSIEQISRCETLFSGIEMAAEPATYPRLAAKNGIKIGERYEARFGGSDLRFE